MNEWKDIAMIAITLGDGGLGWWIKQVANDVKENTKMNLHQDGEIRTLETIHGTKIDNLREITEIQIGGMTHELRGLVRTLERQNELIEKRLNKLENK